MRWFLLSTKITFYSLLLCFALSTNANAQVLIFDNGPHLNVPGNPNISLLENRTLGLVASGWGVYEGFRVADDVILTSSYDVSSVDLYVYQSYAPASPPTIVAAYLQVWDGNPNNPASNIIWGDTSTNILENVVWSNTYRTAETNPALNHPIYRVSVNTTGLNLNAGTYWLEWDYDGSPNYAGPWQVPVVELGVYPHGNSYIYVSSTDAYVPCMDHGDHGSKPIDFPFQMYGIESGGVSASGDLPMHKVTRLTQAFPNPFNPRTTVAFEVAKREHVQLSIFDLQGRLVRSLVNEQFEEGHYLRTWDGINDQSIAAASGAYLVRLTTGSSSDALLVTLLK